ncbi:MAG: protein-L-isoaspartate(D-aspartate) O-methyltransferase [Deltaproteobacteria bacterium]|jgi:protein-L-isoaspartate(D-aspartate) O-methyltransferase|nr:protein-L-isoaspartate(D-aspartate) O-methyltransferase [Deltaproteobacteria bacterium]
MSAKISQAKELELPPLAYPSQPFPGEGELVKPRERMVETQLKARDIVDKAVLEVMARTPRHLFLDEAMANWAYADNPLPIGNGQTISQPYIVAFMTQALELTKKDRVLEIGSGCGYHSAILASLAAQVFAIELLPELFEKGRANIRKLGLKNVFQALGDGSRGWPEMAPFTAMVAAAYGTRTPRRLLEQLSPGGRLIMPLGQPDSQSLVLFRKTATGTITSRNILPCRFVPLVGG